MEWNRITYVPFPSASGEEIARQRVVLGGKMRDQLATVRNGRRTIFCRS